MAEKRLSEYTLAEVQATCSKFAKQHDAGTLAWRCEVCPFADIAGDTCLWRKNPFAWTCDPFTPAELELMKQSRAKYITMSDRKRDGWNDVVELWDERPVMTEGGEFKHPRGDWPLMRADNRIFPSIRLGERWDIAELLAAHEAKGAGERG